MLLIGASAGLWYIWRRNRSAAVDPVIITYPNDMSTNQNLPRGYRNNNPLNIRYSFANAWKGKVLPNTDGAFEQFRDMAYGYRAALYLLRKYITKYGCNTVRKIISKWAPPTENNTEAYIQHVCQFADLLPDMAVTANDADTLTKMAYAMSIIENGQTDETRAAGLPNMEIIYEGWRLL